MGGSSPTESSDKDASPNQAAVTAVAGAISGCVARFVVGPLDVLKIRFQVQVEPVSRKAIRLAASQGTAVPIPKYTGMGQALVSIFREEGIVGLWRGTVPGQLLTIPYCSVQFVVAHQAKAFAKRSGFLDTPFAPAVSFASGATAGVAATVASYPFDLLRTTMAAQGEPKVYKTFVHAARGIIKQDGIKGLYCGLRPTVVEIIPYAALQFGMYDSLNAGMTQLRYRALSSMPWQRAPKREEVKPTAVQQFLCGLMAGIIAKLGTHPLDVAKKRFQIAGLRRSAMYGARINADATKSLWGCLTWIYKNEGLAGLYKGATPSLLKAAPQAAVTFAVYEYVVRELNKAQ